MTELQSPLLCECLLLAGERVMLHPEGALWWPERRMLVVSDLHLEKGSAYAAGGQMLPPYDTSVTLDRVEGLQARLLPETILSLGDSFHDRRAASRLVPDHVARIRRLTAACDWVWIEGNHDPDPPEALGGRGARCIRSGGLVFRHEPEGEPGEVFGHLHPVARVHVRGRSVRRRCFVSDGNRLSMPALGAYAGGLNILDPVFDSLFPDGRSPYVMGIEKVYRVGQSQLVADGPDPRRSGGRARRR